VSRPPLRQASIPGRSSGSPKTARARRCGVRDLGTGEPMTTDLHVRIGSITKTFVATAVLREAGIVDARVQQRQTVRWR
jgi:D-alanyl-D-alanine carboxypeptidase